MNRKARRSTAKQLAKDARLHGRAKADAVTRLTRQLRELEPKEQQKSPTLWTPPVA